MSIAPAHPEQGQSRRSRRRCALRLAALTLAIAGVCGDRAWADAAHVTIIPVSDGNAATDEMGRANTPINAVSFKRQSLTTIGGYQFVSYYHHDGDLMIGRRKQVATGTGWTDWTLRKTEFTSFNINDSHNTSTIAVDGDGYLHVAWGLHNNVMQYTRSNAPVLNDNAFTLNNDTVGNNITTGVLGQEIPLYNKSITYPEFYNVPGSGDLLLSYRTGSSGNGDYHLAKWNNAGNAWQGVRVGTDTDSANPWIDNDFGGDAMPNGNAYLNNLVFSSQNKLVATWTIRTGGDSTTPYKDYQSNHNFYYAASDPNDPSGGGYATWRKQDGTLYRRNGLHDIDENNAQRILQIPEGSSLINQAAMAIDSQDRPLIASWWAPNAATGNHLRQYMLAYHDGTEWKTAQVSNRTSENNNARVPENQLNTFSMSRPIVLVDDDDRVFVVYRDYQRGNGITVSYSESDLRNDWQTLDLTTANLGGWEPSYDRQRWEDAGVLSMYYQPINGQLASTVSVMEWNARAYFATLPGQTYWDVDADGDWALATNWSNDVVPGGIGAAVRFGGSGAVMTGPRAIGLGGTRTVGSLTLNGIGANGFTLNNGTLNLRNADTRGLVAVASGNHTINASIDLGTLGGDLAVSAVGSTLTLNAPLIGEGDLTKSGPGTLVLNGSSSFTGGTTITSGFVQLNSNAALGTGQIVMNPTASGDVARTTLGDGVRIANALTMQTANSGVAAGSLQIASGDSATYAGPITINGPALTGGHFAGGSVSEMLTIEGAIISNSTVLIRQGNMTLAGGGSYANLDIRSGRTAVGATNGIATNAVVDLGGNASTSSAAILDLNGFDQQLRGLKNNVTPANAALVTNTSPLTAVRTLTLSPTDGTTTSFGGSIRGNLALRITGDGMQVLTKTGTTNLNGLFDYAGGTTIDSADATLQLNAAAFNIALTSNAGVDIRNGRLSFDFSAGGSDPTASVIAILDAGFDNGFQAGRLRSSTADGTRGLGWSATAGTNVIVAAALYGDGNLDGAVNFADLVALAQNYNITTGATWARGDTNYDGAVNFADLVKLAQNYNDSIASPAALNGVAGIGFAEQWTLAQSMVPEPASLVMVLAAVSGAAGRSRRRDRLVK